MKKLKICVYAIAKDEEANVERFVHSAAGADYIAVLDTGSADKTVELLSDLGAIVRRETIRPWRFDTARNLSLTLIPPDTDICVCADLDEELSPGWREELESAWDERTVLARFTCVRGGTSFLQSRAHAPGLFMWHYPVHEVLVRADGEPIPEDAIATVPGMETVHHPDESKSREQYLPLLEIGAREEPADPRCAHYLGREYMYYRRWRNAIRELERHLSLPAAVWAEERSASMCYLSECWLWGEEKPQIALYWALRAVAETPERREAWYEAEKAAYHMGDWMEALHYGERAAACERSTTYINEAEAWGGGVEDILSIAAWNLGRCGDAETWARRALALDPGNERIRENVRFYEREIKKARSGV